ncbi:protein sym-1 [Senna tora]|uniref:Protein sym-1 n=1 Tax=Senna tora TaxID=362788 RepID=A0A834SGD7_9FABA|nr:protein sym-1 [Senna tora]
MVSTTAALSLTHKSLLFYRAAKFSRGPLSHFCHQSHILAAPTGTSAIRSCSPHFHNYPLNTSHGVVFKDLGRSGVGLSHLGSEHFRVSAVADDGSGGYGGSGSGNSGGGGDGSGKDGSGGGGEKWSLLSWYLALLGKYPISVKALTSAVLTLIGDLICQLVIDQVPSLDIKRTFLFTLLGFVLVGPTLHLWYLYLSRLVTLPGASGAFLRLLLDQFLFAPAFIGVFLSTLVTLEGRPSQVVPKLQQEWFSAVLANWQLWIPFQFLNFRFVPQQFQVLAANVVSLVWNVILSYKAHKEVLPK